jgi:ribulose-phosphate 3-epimerase
MIVPAILTDKKEEFIKMMSSCSEFCDYVQIDIMDEKFVPSRSITKKDLENLRFPLKIEAHLMVEDPLEWIDVFKQFGSFRIIFHYEIKRNRKEIIEKIKEKNLEVGLAINPSTSLDEFISYCEDVDSFLFMSVNPGFYGSPFIPQVLEKIKLFKRMHPLKMVGIDGGIKLYNLKEVIGSGVDYICVGSAIFKENNFKEAYLKLKKELEKTKKSDG